MKGDGQRGGRMEGEMEVGRKGEKEKGRGTNCVLPTSTEVFELLEVTLRFHVHEDRLGAPRKWGLQFPMFSLSIDFVTRHTMTFWNR